MLRLPITQIDLTVDDIDGYETRFATRRMRQRQSSASSLHLNAGPGRLTSNAVVAENMNVDRRGAGHQVSVAHDERCDTTLDAVVHENNQQTITRVRLTEAAIDSGEQRQLPHDMLQRQAECAWSRQSSSALTQNIGGFSLSGHAMSGTMSQIDGMVEWPRETVSGASNDSANTPAMISISALREINSDAFLVSSTLPSSPRPFSSARARRRQIFHDPIQQQELIELRHRERIPPYQSSSILSSLQQPVPHLVLPLHDESSPGLDPGAPVFVPRTRFASSVAYNSDGPSHSVLQEGRTATGHSSSNLRVRPISEQNVEVSFRGQSHSVHTLTEPFRTRNRFSSQTSSQSGPLPRLSSDLSHHAPPRSDAIVSVMQRGGSGLWPAAAPIFNVSRHSHGDISSSMRVGQLQYHVRHVTSVQQTHLPIGDRTTIDNISSLAAMANQESALRLPDTVLVDATSSHHQPIPESSPSDNDREFSTADMQDISHCVKVEGRTDMELLYQSSLPDFSHMSSYRRNHSPLEQLTEELSRLSASLERPRSVGRWFESRPRISLLYGDPFVEQSRTPSPDVAKTADRVNTGQLLDSDPSSPVPPSIASFLHSSTPAVLGTAAVTNPSWHLTPTKSPASSPPLSISVPTASPPSIPTAIARSPNAPHSLRPVILSTPRVRVYNDAVPPQTQPQAPADLLQSRTRQRKQSNVAEPAPRAAQSSTLSPDVDSTPAHAPTLTTMLPASESPALPVTVPRFPSTYRPPARGRGRMREMENELEGFEAHLAELREERMVWLSRRSAGGGAREHDGQALEVTPPGQGRFERMLSGG
nr:hypothetical protein CFP56_12877 [Quercus suber]